MDYPKILVNKNTKNTVKNKLVETNQRIEPADNFELNSLSFCVQF
jgi:hypothetical protein